MKKLILLALAFVTFGCGQKVDKAYTVASRRYCVITIDSCEYIIGIHRLVHKGNCKYCAERRRKEQEELIRRLKEE